VLDATVGHRRDQLQRRAVGEVLPLVITEVVYLLSSRLGAQAELSFLGDVASGAFDVEPVHAVDWLRIADLVGRYRDLPLGTVDASVIRVC